MSKANALSLCLRDPGTLGGRVWKPLCLSSGYQLGLFYPWRYYLCVFVNECFLLFFPCTLSCTNTSQFLMHSSLFICSVFGRVVQSALGSFVFLLFSMQEVKCVHATRNSEQTFGSLYLSLRHKLVRRNLATSANNLLF